MFIDHVSKGASTIILFRLSLIENVLLQIAGHHVETLVRYLPVAVAFQCDCTGPFHVNL